jgi:hypothetical protein
MMVTPKMGARESIIGLTQDHITQVLRHICHGASPTLLVLADSEGTKLYPDGSRWGCDGGKRRRSEACVAVAMNERCQK